MRVLSALALTTLIGASVVLGQMRPPEHGPGPGGMRAFGMRGSGKTVTGLPYSATVTNTTTRVLADGNTITRTTTGTVSRDSSGRTVTTETITGMFGQAGTRTITFITDPVAGYAYTLNPETKTAMRRALHQRTGSSAGSWGSSASAAAKPVNPNAVTADLGLQVLNGVNVQGKSVTHTIPAGAMGNEKPIISKSETWFSPDLQVVVSSTRTDPREGISTYALTNIQRTEPAAGLFQVPSDYSIEDAPSFRGVN